MLFVTHRETSVALRSVRGTELLEIFQMHFQKNQKKKRKTNAFICLKREVN